MLYSEFTEGTKIHDNLSQYLSNYEFYKLLEQVYNNSLLTKKDTYLIADIIQVLNKMCRGFENESDRTDLLKKLIVFVADLLKECCDDNLGKLLLDIN